ncbi:MAG: hypothetical protein ACRC2K_12480, partial [Clostridium sp.]
MKRLLSSICIFLLMTTLIILPPKEAKAQTSSPEENVQTPQEENKTNVPTVQKEQAQIEEPIEATKELPLNQSDIVEAQSTFTVNLETEKSFKIVNTTTEKQVLKVNGDSQYMFNYLRNETSNHGEEFQTRYIFVNTKTHTHHFGNYIELEPKEEITLSNDGASKTLTIP